MAPQAEPSFESPQFFPLSAVVLRSPVVFPLPPVIPVVFRSLALSTFALR